MVLFCRVISGDITQKGYEKKKSLLLAPYMPNAPLGKCICLSFFGVCKGGLLLRLVYQKRMHGDLAQRS